MDDGIVNLLALVITLLIAGAGLGIRYRLRNFLKDVSDLLLALEKCMDKDCTTDEIHNIVKETQEVVAGGLGFWSALISIFKR